MLNVCCKCHLSMWSCDYVSGQKMPYRDRTCEFCGKHVQGQNFVRHKTRHHGDQLSKDDSQSDTAKSDVSFEQPSTPPRRSKPKTAKPTCQSSVTIDYLQDSVMCMLRRTADVNLPALTHYLSVHLPDLSADWHVPVVVSAFYTAQRSLPRMPRPSWEVMVTVRPWPNAQWLDGCTDYVQSNPSEQEDPGVSQACHRHRRRG